MTVTWLGQNCIKIEGKNATVVIDPVSSKVGKMPKVSADVVVASRPALVKDTSFLKTEAFTIETPGEFEAKNVFVRTMPTGQNGDLVSRLDIDQVSFGHLGFLKKIDDTVTSFLDGVDVLFVPTGGGEVLGPAEAADVVSAIEPRIVIPMHFRRPEESSLLPVEKFRQAMGMNNGEPQSKFSFSVKDLPHEETQLVVLQA